MAPSRKKVSPQGSSQVQITAIKRVLRQERREHHEEMAMADGELKMLSDRLLVLLPVYWAAKALLGSCHHHAPILKKDWDWLVKAVVKAKRILEKKSVRPRTEKKPRPIP